MEAIHVLLTEGGVATYFIILSAILMIVFSIEKFIVLYMQMSFDSTEAIEKIKTYVLEKNYGQAIQICQQRKEVPDLEVVKTALLDIESGREAMRSAMGSKLMELSEKTERRLSLLALIASIATLLGLLGTVTGLMKTFAALANVDPAKKAQVLGAGISEAMYATAAGLSVGIAALVLHTVFSNKSISIRIKARNTGLKVINWIEKSERA